MQQTRYLSFCILVGAFLFFEASVSAGGHFFQWCEVPSCNGCAGYSDDGSCPGLVEQEQGCWGACSYCYDTEDMGDPISCDEFHDETGDWYAVICDCGFAR